MKWQKRAKLRLSEIESRSGEVRGKVDAAQALITELQRERAALARRVETVQATPDRFADERTERELSDLADEIAQVDDAIARANARRDLLAAEAGTVNGIAGRCRKVAQELGIYHGAAVRAGV